MQLMRAWPGLWLLSERETLLKQCALQEVRMSLGCSCILSVHALCDIVIIRTAVNVAYSNIEIVISRDTTDSPR